MTNNTKSHVSIVSILICFWVLVYLLGSAVTLNFAWVLDAEKWSEPLRAFIAAIVGVPIFLYIVVSCIGKWVDR